MRVQFRCPECPTTPSQNQLGFVFVSEYRDNGCYEFECPRGHEFLGLLQNQRFEILFDIGAFAILDGYYREAVTSFASSLERFYEFYFSVALHAAGHDFESISDTWKVMAKQSERQLGAYCAVYLQRNKSTAPTLNQKQVAFRNSVVHAGVIPSRAGAIEFGQSVLELLLPRLHELKTTAEESLFQTVARSLQQSAAAITSRRRRTTLGQASMLQLSVSAASTDTRSMAERLDELRILREMGVRG